MNNLSWSSGIVPTSNTIVEPEKEKIPQNYTKEIKDLKKILDNVYEKYELYPTNYGSGAVIHIKSAIDCLSKTIK